MVLVNTTSVDSGLAMTTALAVVTYLWFKHYEPTDIVSLSVLLGFTPAIPAVLLGSPMSSTVAAVLTAYTVHYGIILACIVAYRLSPFHPLYKYPGPLLGKLSKLTLVYVASTGKQHHYFLRMHRKYGSIVRVGPNELSIVDAELLPNIMGPDGMPKGPLWKGRQIGGKKGSANTHPKGTLINARDKGVHAENRRVWNRAFTSSAVKRYEPTVIRLASQLVDELKKRCSADAQQENAVDLSQWLSFFSFDFMGDFVFGGPFELLTEGDKNGLVHTVESGLYPTALIQHIPWCVGAVVNLPFVAKQMKGLGMFAYTQTLRRLQAGSVHDDLFYHLADEAGLEKQRPTVPYLISNMVTAIIAGSDTTAVALTAAFCLLASHPTCYARLQVEIDEAFPPHESEPTDTAKMAQLPYLNAIINETLRLHPPGATSLQRAPTEGSGGHMLGRQIFISEGTAVYSPPYRWIEKDHNPNIILNTDAFMPFSTGPANCVGRPLALIEMRMVLVYVLRAFDLRLKDGFDAERWREDLRDLFVTIRGPLLVVLTPRH
ncbi:cytochrome P450 [Fomitopsis serialis]|uniref:cytochrome P450 n=1 Tax=Fomitopsis serialis TaxID=139415 RepID=UPI002007339A|nr:cytochrome P450 [Neoantrodia serialis]KAH9932278.1 cytochrome P450 [Neoantrodia serialis]